MVQKINPQEIISQTEAFLADPSCSRHVISLREMGLTDGEHVFLIEHIIDQGEDVYFLLLWPGLVVRMDIDKHNKELTDRRIYSVKEYLRQQTKVIKRRIETIENMMASKK